MKELKCPKCGNVFSVDEADYASLLNQVKTAEFESELTRRIHEMEVAQLARQKAEQQAAQAQQQAEQIRREQHFQEQLAAGKDQLMTLQNQLAQAEQAKQLAVAEVRQKATESYMKVQQEMAQEKTKWEEQLKAAKEQIAYYKEMKLRMSTKMVGETLEIHCSTLFNQLLRPLMPYAYFEKDNEVIEGTKGDFVFRDKSGVYLHYVRDEERE